MSAGLAPVGIVATGVAPQAGATGVSFTASINEQADTPTSAASVDIATTASITEAADTLTSSAGVLSW
jgi:hypothetical protein